MGHEIIRLEYKDGTSKKEISADANEWSLENSDSRGPLHSGIRWYDSTILESRKEADEFISKHDNQWYDQLAVRFKKYPENTKQKEAAQKIDAMWKEYHAKNAALHFKDAKSALISCKKCGSKISTQYLKRNTCPVCGEDMRPPTTLAALLKLKNKITLLQHNLDNIKPTGKPEIFWLVKIEYHV